MTAAPSPVEVADLLLALSVQRRVAAVSLEPGPSGYHVTAESAGASRLVLILPAGLAAAVSARIALIAQLDLAARPEHLGRIQVSAAGRPQGVLVMLAPEPRGLRLELRQLAPPTASREAARRRPEGHPGHLGHYRLLSVLGHGGTGTVYRGEHVALGKAVAIKILHAEIAPNDGLAAALLHEGRLATRVPSASIVGVTDYGLTDDGRPYLVMELMEWPTLYAALGGKSFSPARAVAIAREILVALAAAHAHGIVHRDLKPENVFLGPSDAVKIGDFGLAKVVSPDDADRGSDFQGGHAYGSPPYMSPEQCRGLLTDHRTDLYAVGCMLFEMLTGNVPFFGDNRNDIMIKHMQAPPPEPESPYLPLPSIVRAVVRRALEKDRYARYASAGDMIADLDRCAAALARTGWQKWLPA